MSKKLKIIFFISIVINVLLIGVMIGHFSTRYFTKQYFKRHFTEIAAGLPPEKQKMLMDAKMELHKESRATKRKIHKIRKEIGQILSAPRFDEQLFDKKVTELHDLHGEMAKGLAEVTKNLAQKFTPEERRVLAEILKKRPHRRPSHDRFDRHFRQEHHHDTPHGHPHPDRREGPNRRDF